MSVNLMSFMHCEQLDSNLFRGQSRDLKTGQVYGGQVLGQAIRAASLTVDTNRAIRSAHAYFLLKGDVNAPIIYEVDRSLDGGSISTRRIVAIQHGRQIFHMSASFQVEEEGLEFQAQSDIPLNYLNAQLKAEKQQRAHFQSQFLDVVFVDEAHLTKPNVFQLWVKAKETLPNTREVHNAVLAYISDMGVLASTLVPHGLHPRGPATNNTLIMASIDHAIWFHRPFKADEWFFCDCQAVSTQNGRGLGQARLYTKEGELFASIAQEGLIRVKREK